MRFLSKLFLPKGGASLSALTSSLAFFCSTMAAHAELPLVGIIAQGRACYAAIKGIVKSTDDVFAKAN
jgi:hypothetical protein